ncbi:MAG: Crp/Fnr family transcriptional regulator [Eubacterium sp.]
MKKYLSVIKASKLFEGIAEKDIESLLVCLSGKTRSYDKDEYVLHFGDYIRNVGMVLTGGVNIIKEDYWGNRNIVTAIMPGELFAESYACTNSEVLKVSVQATQNSEILFLDINCILGMCSDTCNFHMQLIKNFVLLLASKNLIMSEKITYITQRSIREKLISYLSAESVKQDSSNFEIVFNRQELADYLSVDRSAMSNELSKMQKEGILKYKKNKFSLLKNSPKSSS